MVIKNTMSSSSSTRKSISQCLETLIEVARASWTYAIFWELLSVDQGLLLRWADGYYREENDNEEIRKNSPMLPASSLQEHGIKVPPKLGSATGGGLTHAECFFSTSKHKYFVPGTGGLGQALNCRSPVWITGDEKLASSHCERAFVAQSFGFQTLALIPAADGVVELGSIYWITQRYEFDLFEKVKQLLDSTYSKEKVCFQDRACVPGPSSPGNESESSNSVGNDSMVHVPTCNDGAQSNFSFPASKMALSLGLNSGLNTICRLDKAKIEIQPSCGVGDGKSSFPGKSSFSYIGKRKRSCELSQSNNSFTNNKMDLTLGLSLTSRPVKPKIEFKPSVGSLSPEPRYFGSSESDSDNADISAFIRILRRDP